MRVRYCSDPRFTKSAAADSQVANSNEKPASRSRFGVTRRLFRMSSVSVFINTAPISTIHLVPGNPTRFRSARRNVAMNSRCVTGLGAARFTGP